MIFCFIHLMCSSGMWILMISTSGLNSLPPSRVPDGSPGPPQGSRHIHHAPLSASRSSEAVSSGEHHPGGAHPFAHKPLSLNWHRTLHGLTMSHRPSNAHEGVLEGGDHSVGPPHSHLAPPDAQHTQPLLTQVPSPLQTINDSSK